MTTAPTGTEQLSLTERTRLPREDQAVLDLAYSAARLPLGTFERRCAEQFDLRPTPFWQRVNQLIDTQAAAAYNPAGTRRLRDRRDRVVTHGPWHVRRNRSAAA